MSRYTHPLARLVFLICVCCARGISGSRCGRNRPQRFSLACQNFLFSLGVSRGDISLFERKHSEIMNGDEPLISVNDLHKRPIQVAHHGLVSDSAILHSSKSRANVRVVSCRDAGFEPCAGYPAHRQTRLPEDTVLDRRKRMLDRAPPWPHCFWG